MLHEEESTVPAQFVVTFPPELLLVVPKLLVNGAKGSDESGTKPVVVIGIPTDPENDNTELLVVVAVNNPVSGLYP